MLHWEFLNFCWKITGISEKPPCFGYCCACPTYFHLVLINIMKWWCMVVIFTSLYLAFAVSAPFPHHLLIILQTEKKIYRLDCLAGVNTCSSSFKCSILYVITVFLSYYKHFLKVMGVTKAMCCACITSLIYKT